MKSYNNLFIKLLDEDFIKESIKDASHKKLYRDDVQEVLSNIDYHVQQIKQILLSESFKSPPHTPKVINEYSCRKTRRIICPNFKYEQIIHHMVIRVLEPLMTKRFYTFSCSSIPGRGSSYGKRYMEKWIKSYGDKKFYVLKFDIRHFFENVDRNVLKSMLRKFTRDNKFYRLLCKIIDYSISFRGIPLGFYTSQWFANFYLTAFDYYVKQILGAEYYMRYADDIVILDTNKSKLHRMFKKISKYLKEHLKLSIKPDWQIFKFSYTDKEGNEKGRCLDFMGFKFYRNRTTLRKSILYRIRRKVNKIYKKWKHRKRINWYECSQLLAYLGWLKQCKIHNYFNKYIRNKIPIRKLKHIVSNHSRLINNQVGV